MRILKRLLYAFFAAIIIYTIYRFSVIALIFGFNDTSREIFFVPVVFYFFIPILRNFKNRNLNIKRIKVYKKIKNIYKKISDFSVTPLLGLTLKDKEKTVDIDSVIVTEKGIFNIVLCDYNGDIEVKKNNKWIKIKSKNKDVELLSPINKVRKNRLFLNKIYGEESIIDVIVMTDFTADVYEEEKSDADIVRADDLLDYIESYNSDERYDSDELYDKLYPYIFKEKDLEKEFSIYEKYLDYKWQYRSRIAFISVGIIFYVLRTIEYSR